MLEGELRPAAQETQQVFTNDLFRGNGMGMRTWKVTFLLYFSLKCQDKNPSLSLNLIFSFNMFSGLT